MSSELSVHSILQDLKKKPVIDIIQWIVVNLEVTQLIECLKEINIRSYNAFIREKESAKDVIGTFPVNFPYQAGSIEDTLLGLIEMSKKSRYIPIGYIPKLLPDAKSDKQMKISILYLRKVKSSKGKNYCTSKAEVATIDEFINLVIGSRKDIEIHNGEQLDFNDIKKSFTEALQQFQEEYKPEFVQVKKINNETNVSFDNEKTYKDIDLYLMPYGMGTAWEYNKEEKKQGVYHIYSRLFTPNDYKKWEEYFKEGKSNCALLAFDDSRPCSKYFVKRYNKNGKFDEYGWYRNEDLKDYCADQWNDKNKLTVREEAQYINNLKKGVPFHTRVYGKWMPDKIWNSKEDLRMYTRGVYKNRIPQSAISQKDSCDSKEKAEESADSFIDGVTGATGATDSAFLLGAVDPTLSKEKQEKMIKRIYEISTGSNDCALDAFDTVMSEDDAKSAFDTVMSDDDAKSAFGSLQLEAAKKNVYITGVRFGSKPKFYAYLFNKDNEKKWKKDRMTKNIKGEWMGEKQLKQLLKKQKSPRTSKETTEAFKEFDNIMIPEKDFHYGQDIQLRPLHPSAFGYIQKQKKWPVNRSYGQLYPLGKDAFFKGPHQGVSSTFSEQFSKKHGLWNPSPVVPAKQRIVGQFQYGNNMRKKKKSCFGSVEPNMWTRNGVKNAYTGRNMSGIPINQYGYKGTQWVFGGNTGVGGYPSLSNQIVQQGLLPRRSVGSTKKNKK